MPITTEKLNTRLIFISAAFVTAIIFAIYLHSQALGRSTMTDLLQPASTNSAAQIFQYENVSLDYSDNDELCREVEQIFRAKDTFNFRKTPLSIVVEDDALLPIEWEEIDSETPVEAHALKEWIADDATVQTALIKLSSTHEPLRFFRKKDYNEQYGPGWDYSVWDDASNDNYLEGDTRVTYDSFYFQDQFYLAGFSNNIGQYSVNLVRIKPTLGATFGAEVSLFPVCELTFQGINER